jgi:hypothetical protein
MPRAIELHAFASHETAFHACDPMACPGVGCSLLPVDTVNPCPNTIKVSRMEFKRIDAAGQPYDEEKVRCDFQVPGVTAKEIVKSSRFQTEFGTRGLGLLLGDIDGIANHKPCHTPLNELKAEYYIDGKTRRDWETVVERCNVVEILDKRTRITYAQYTRVWPASARELLNCVHSRQLETADKWLSITFSCDHVRGSLSLSLSLFLPLPLSLPPHDNQRTRMASCHPPPSNQPPFIPLALTMSAVTRR